MIVAMFTVPATDRSLPCADFVGVRRGKIGREKCFRSDHISKVPFHRQHSSEPLLGKASRDHRPRSV